VPWLPIVPPNRVGFAVARPPDDTGVTR
jgi:hypothetical protein